MTDNTKKNAANDTQRSRTSILFTPDTINREQLPHHIDLFMAGGISGCWNWQDALYRAVSYHLDSLLPTGWELDHKPFTIASPRRAHGLEKDGKAASEQIAWEYEAMSRTAFTSFYFTRDTVQPITLLELGKHLAQPWGSCIVACELGYERAFDVYAQTNLSLQDATLNHGVEKRAYGWPYIGSFIGKDASPRGFRGSHTIFFDENKPQEDHDFLNKTWFYALTIAYEMIAKRTGSTFANLTASNNKPFNGSTTPESLGLV